MPFSDVKYKMTIIGVKEANSQKTLDSFVSQKLNQGIDVAFPISEIKLGSFTIPSFTLELGVELSEILQDSPFNMKKPFSNQADFSNLFHNESVHIDKVIHKASIKIDEAGAEASAATAVTMVRNFNPEEIRFVINSPFAFVLSDDSSNTILFAGKVNKL